jgi:archaellum biogenesis ATPase FlaH
VNPWISASASLVAALIGGTIAFFGVSRTLRAQVRLQDRAHLATITREMAGWLVAVDIAMDSFAATRSEDDRRDLVSALDSLLPQARVVGLTVPAGLLRKDVEAVGTACSDYRRRLRRARDPGLGTAEQAAREAIKAAADTIQARFGNTPGRH